MTENQLPICRFGSNCYRKNPAHLKEYFHPSTTFTVSDARQACESPRHDAKRAKVSTKSEEEDEEDEESNVQIESPKQNDGVCLSENSSRSDRKKFIKARFLFDMPDDFYALWDAALTINPDNPCNAFANTSGFVLCGPFDVLAGKFDKKNEFTSDDLLLHQRFFYDVPEFQTVMRMASGTREKPFYHIGYLRDDCTDPLNTVVCANSGEDCKLDILGDNLFCAILNIFGKLEDSKEVKTIIDRLRAEAQAGDFSLEKLSKKVKQRKKSVVAETFHGAGIVVPVENDVGYRSLGITNAKLKRILVAMCQPDEDVATKNTYAAQLDDVITCVQFANDECDFGMGYELGIDIFCFGNQELHSYVAQLLTTAYTLLEREHFKNILLAHLSKRTPNEPLTLV